MCVCVVIRVCCNSSTYLMRSQDTECVGQVSCQRVVQKNSGRD